MNSLLPPNATALERRIEQVMGNVDNLPVPLRDLWNPDTCPAELLPWLAWQLSIDAWKSYWPEYVKRARVRAALEIQRHKGTVESVRNVVESFGGSVEMREWFQAEPRGVPGTFELWLTATGEGGTEATAAFVDDIIAEITRTKPVSRHFSFTQGVNVGADIGVAAIARPATYARLVLHADAADPYEDLDLLAPTLDPRITFTRASTKTYFGSDGLLHTAAVNECPLEYDPVTLLPVGRSFWEARTNLTLHSQDKIAWGAPRGTLTDVPLGGPLGTGAVQFNEADGVTGGQHAVGNVFSVTAGATYSTTVFIKPIGRLYFTVGTSSAVNAGLVLTKVDLNGAGVVVALGSGVTSASVTPLVNGIWKITQVYTATLSTSTALDVFSCADATFNQSITGDGSKGLQLAVQVEAAATPGPYIHTTTSQVTRAADVATVNDLSTLRFNPAEGTLYAEYLGVQVFGGSTFPGVCTLYKSASSQRLGFYSKGNGQTSANMKDATGTVIFGVTSNPFAAGSPLKSALAYGSTSASAAGAVSNGALYSNNYAALPTGFEVLRIGLFDAALNAPIRRIRYYPTRLTDAQLQALTA